jgi:S1-C subfamily serine protease
MNSAIPENGKWGKELDYNYFVASEAHKVKFSTNGCDLNSAFGEANFIDAAKGDFRVADNSEALKIGFVNFAMDQFGVQKPSLKAIAKTPIIPSLRISYDKAVPVASVLKITWLDVELKEPKGDEMSAFGIAFDAGGVALSTVQPDGLAAKLGFKTGDLLQEVNSIKIKTIADLNSYLNQNTAIKKYKFILIRDQTKKELIINQKLPFTLQ